MNVKITDMKEFLQAVDSCTGDVYLVYPRGGTENIRLNPMRQAELVDEWRANASRSRWTWKSAGITGS